MAGLPRSVEAVVAAGTLLVLSPLLGVTAVLVAVGSGFPIVFRQKRIGRYGHPFTMYKFRTMRSGRSGPAVTASDDVRITPVGRLLRSSKLDELPELWNVVRGDMSLVGPRPEAPRYVLDHEPRWRSVLAVRPGLTDPTTLSLLDEELLLGAVAGDRETYYVNELLPRKLDGYIEYLQRRTWRTDVEVLAHTVASVLKKAIRG